MNIDKLAGKIVGEIEMDLRDRSGMGWDDLDDGTEEEIRETWRKLVSGLIEDAWSDHESGTWKD